MKYVIINAKLLNGHRDMHVEEGKYIYVNEGKIEKITKSLEDGYDIVDLEGKYILPGLINMHVHLAGNGAHSGKQKDNKKTVDFLFSNPVTKAIAYQMVCNFAKLELYGGVTTIRTVGGLKDLDTRLRNEIKAGKKTGPTILAANEGITVEGGHMAGSVARVAKNNEEAKHFVEASYAQGVDLVKLMVTGGVLDAKEKGVPGEMKMPEDMIQTICKKAHQLGLLTSAHVESTEGVKAALRNGVDSIEHGAKPDQEMIDLFKEKKAFLITTLSPALPFALFDPSVSKVDDTQLFNGKMVFDGIVECSKAALENHIPVGLGNDVGCPWITQYDFYRELVYFHKYVGVTNGFALYTATLQNAILAGISDVTGSIDAGKQADMIVVKENPLDDLNALKNIDIVFTKGKMVHPKIKRDKEIEKRLDAFCK